MSIDIDASPRVSLTLNVFMNRTTNLVSYESSDDDEQQDGNALSETDKPRRR